ncbi:MAG: hypothetical protein RSA01_00160 [Clostridium sp.]|uniref:hypothetical protein n=1 Tax=Clostridium sp. TaxID=1506 RepID=UPI002FC6D561
MSSTYIIDGFRSYMEGINLEKSQVDYNIKVMRTFLNTVLSPQGKDLDSIDIYAFEEFTDLTEVIDNDLGGKSGIGLILDAFLNLTEYLKINKIIKGGKIAYYRRIFTNKEYYLDKYEAIKGKKDGTREYIRKITKNRISQNIVRVLEDINTNEIKLLRDIENVLDEEYENEAAPEVIDLLKSIEFITYKGKRMVTTKKGRAILRLEPEERYAGILYAFIYEAIWFDSIKLDKPYILKAISSVSSIFQLDEDINILNYSIDEEGYLVVCNNSYRLSRFLESSRNKLIFDVLFVGLGMVKKVNDQTYSLTLIGSIILKLLSSESEAYLKYRLKRIDTLLKNKNYSNLESEILDFIVVFGESSTMIDYLGQILILKSKYKDAYKVLSYGYERAEMKSSRAKKILTHLIICCRKLEFKGEEGNYTKKLNLIDK